MKYYRLCNQLGFQTATLQRRLLVLTLEWSYLWLPTQANQNAPPSWSKTTRFRSLHIWGGISTFNHFTKPENYTSHINYSTPTKTQRNWVESPQESRLNCSAQWPAWYFACTNRRSPLLLRNWVASALATWKSASRALPGATQLIRKMTSWWGKFTCKKNNLNLARSKKLLCCPHATDVPFAQEWIFNKNGWEMDWNGVDIARSRKEGDIIFCRGSSPVEERIQDIHLCLKVADGQLLDLRSFFGN